MYRCILVFVIHIQLSLSSTVTSIRSLKAVMDVHSYVYIAVETRANWYSCKQSTHLVVYCNTLPYICSSNDILSQYGQYSHENDSPLRSHVANKRKCMDAADDKKGSGNFTTISWK